MCGKHVAFNSVWICSWARPVSASLTAQDCQPPADVLQDGLSSVEDDESPGWRCGLNHIFQICYCTKHLETGSDPCAYVALYNALHNTLCCDFQPFLCRSKIANDTSIELGPVSVMHAANI